MPLYEYACQKCGFVFEKLVSSMKAAEAPECPQCQGETRKKFSTFAAHTGANPTACGLSEPSCSTGQQHGGCCGGSCPHAH